MDDGVIKFQNHWKAGGALPHKSVAALIEWKDRLFQKGLLKGNDDFSIKILGTGSLTKKLAVTVNAVSKSALQAIQKAGGSVTLA